MAYLRLTLGEGKRALPGKVLVVEDNELNLKLFCDLLEVHDFVPTPVRDGARGDRDRARGRCPI